MQTIDHIVALTAPKGAATDGFQTRSLSAPAAFPFTIAFTNDDTGVQHNVVVAAQKTADPTGAIAAGQPVTGVGTVDAGLIGAFVLFGEPASTVFPAILLFRLIGFWLPIPFGVWAFIQLRRTVHRWADEDSPATIQSEVTVHAG